MSETIIQRKQSRRVTLTLNRPERRNALSEEMLVELNRVLGELEKDADCAVIVLEGKDGFFCTGMDFEEFSVAKSTESAVDGPDSNYMRLLKSIASSGKVVVSVVEGQALAGGIGLVAASDLVVATPASSFGLPEALWGLLPACVAPFLIRRVGFQKAYKMALTTQTIGAEEAGRIGLVDEVHERPEEILRRYLLRLSCLDASTVRSMKSYFQKMWIINEEMERTAVEELSRLTSSARVRENIRNFQLHKRFPWETT